MDKTIRVWDVEKATLLKTLLGHSKPVSAIAFSEDGQHLVSASEDTTIKVWDALGGSQIHLMRSLDSALNSCALLPGDRQVVSAQTDCKLAIFDVVSGRRVRSLADCHARSINHVSVSPNGRLVCSSSDDGTARIWSVGDWNTVCVLTGHTGPIAEAAFSPQSDRLVTASDDFSLIVWDVTKPSSQSELQQAQRQLEQVSETVACSQLVRRMRGHTGMVRSCDWSSNGRLIASASRDTHICLWFAETGKLCSTLTGSLDWITCCRFSPNSKLLASASWDYNIILWDVKSGNRVNTLSGHHGAVSAVSFAPDGTRLASASFDGTLKIWDPRAGHEVTTLRGHQRRVLDCMFSSSGNAILSCSDDATARLWDAVAGTEVATLQGHSAGVRSVAFNPTTKQVISAGDDNAVRVWEPLRPKKRVGAGAADGHGSSSSSSAFALGGSFQDAAAAEAAAAEEEEEERVAAAEGRAAARGGHHSDWVTQLAYHPNGTQLLSCSRDCTVLLHDASEHAVLSTVCELQQRSVNGALFLPTGEVVTVSDDGALRVWPLKKKQSSSVPAARLLHEGQPIKAVCLSADGQHAGTVGWDNALRHHDGKTLGTATASQASIKVRDWLTSCAVSTDGEHLAAGCYDNRVYVWTCDAGGRMRALVKHSNWVLAVAFSPDKESRHLASASFDGSVVLWEWRTETAVGVLQLGKRVNCVAFSNCGRYLFTGSHRQRCAVWSVKSLLLRKGADPKLAAEQCLVAEFPCKAPCTAIAVSPLSERGIHFSVGDALGNVQFLSLVLPTDDF